MTDASCSGAVPFATPARAAARRVRVRAAALPPLGAADPVAAI